MKNPFSPKTEPSVTNNASPSGVAAPPAPAPSPEWWQSIEHQFRQLWVVPGKYVPFHDATEKATASLPSPFRITDETTPGEIPIPGPHPLLRHIEDEGLHLQTGRYDVMTLRTVLKEDGFQLAPNHRILDFGCFTGRMLRWLLDDVRRGVEAWGVDIHAEAIEWCSVHMSPPFQFATTTSAPPLPFPSAYFDLVYAGSVFTHTTDLMFSWLLEIKRILQPGGRAYLTFNDDASVALIEQKWKGTWDDIMWRRALAESGRTLSEVNFISVGQSPYSAVFYNRSRLIDRLSQLFLVKRVRDEGFGWQSAYLVEKPVDRSAS